MKGDLTDFISSWQQQLILESDTVLKWEEEKRPIEFKQNELNHTSKTIHVHSIGFISTSNEHCLRTVHFYSTQLQIFTLLILPIGNPDLHPGFILEFVIAGQQIHIGIIDIENIVEPKKQVDFHRELETIKNKIDSLSNYYENTSDWFKQIASNEAIVYQGKIEQINLLKTTSFNYLKCYLNYCKTKKLNLKKELIDHESVKNYKELHLIHTPAFRIVNNEQDKKWMQIFLKDYHFKIYE